jgi:hypothetical protein
MPDPVDQDDAHAEAEELLPWYATGQLDRADRALVEGHLVACARCQRQLLAERRLIDEFQSLVPEIDRGWHRLRTQIEPRRTGPRRDIVQTVSDLWRTLSRPAVAALAFAQLALVVLAGMILLSMNRPAYRALGSSQAPPAANVLVIFRPDAAEEDIRVALRATGASLVGGPTAANAYLLHVEPKRRDSAVVRLQSDDDVQVAQPIDEPAR